jgi:hypothetical protein
LADCESSMHHCDKSCTHPIGKNRKKEDYSNSQCDYHMANNPGRFEFLKSWDDLATYNIAKKGIEYISKTS